MASDEFTLTLSPRDYSKLLTVLSQLSKIEVDAVVKQGLREGLRVIINQGKANLQSSSINLNNVYPGKMGVKRGGKHLIKSFHTYIKTHANSSPTGYAGFAKNKGGAFAHMIDRGTKDRKTKKPYRTITGKTWPAGIKRGKVTGNKFWTRAIESKSKEAQLELFDSVRKSINRILNRNT